MLRVLIELWPALLPILGFLLWHFFSKRKAIRLGLEPPLLKNGPWFRLVLATIIIAVSCLLLFGLSQEHEKGAYVPATLEGGNVTPGHITRE